VIEWIPHAELSLRSTPDELAVHREDRFPNSGEKFTRRETEVNTPRQDRDKPSRPGVTLWAADASI